MVCASSLASQSQTPSRGFKVTAFLLQSLACRVAALWPQISNALVDNLSFKTVKSERVLNLSSKATGLLVGSEKVVLNAVFAWSHLNLKVSLFTVSVSAQAG